MEQGDTQGAAAPCWKGWGGQGASSLLSAMAPHRGGVPAPAALPGVLPAHPHHGPEPPGLPQVEEEALVLAALQGLQGEQGEQEPPRGIPIPLCLCTGDGGMGQWGWGQVMGHLAGCSRQCPLCQVPVELVLLLTVPVVDPDKDDLNWRRPLNCLHILTSPLLCVLTLKSGTCKSLGQSQLPEGDRTEMATKALGSAGACLSELAHHFGEEGWAGRAKLCLQRDTPSQGWGAWILGGEWSRPGLPGETEAQRGAAL